MRTVKRETIRDQVQEILRERILRQELEPGTRLNESELADQLNVSRGPLREALGRLEREGLLRSEPGKGHFVEPLTRCDAEELYHLLAGLETLAVVELGSVEAERRGRLETLNERLATESDDPGGALALNARWHEMLADASGNRKLKRMLRTLRQQVYRYEYRFFSEAGGLGKSVEYHDAIVEALKAGDHEAVSRAIRRHWLTDLDRILPRLPETSKKEG